MRGREGVRTTKRSHEISNNHIALVWFCWFYFIIHIANWVSLVLLFLYHKPF